MQKIRPCLWFDTEGEEAAALRHLGVPEFAGRRSKSLRLGRSGPEGTVMAVDFELKGQKSSPSTAGPSSRSTRRCRSRRAARPRRKSTSTGRAHRGRRR